MRKTFLMVAAVAAMLVATGFTACKPNSTPKEVDIYVAGYDKSGTNTVAKVWKNGKDLYELTDGSKGAGAFSVFVVGGDVYSSGFEDNGTNWVAKVWKNDNELYTLTDGSNYACANSVFVADDKVYTAGYDGSVAKLWKNKSATDLTDGSKSAGALSVFVAGSNVYTAGYDWNVTKVWKKGKELYSLADKGGAYSIFIVER